MTSPMFPTAMSDDPFANAPMVNDPTDDPFHSYQPGPAFDTAVPAATAVSEATHAATETTVSVSVSRKHNGDLFSETYSETVPCTEMDPSERAALRMEVSQILRAEAEAMVALRIRDAGPAQPSAGLPGVPASAGHASPVQPQRQHAGPQGPALHAPSASNIASIGAGTGHAGGAGGMLRETPDPNNPKKIVRWVPSSVVSSAELLAGMQDFLDGYGVPEAAVQKFDNRVGQRGFENGVFSHFVVSCRFRPGASPLCPLLKTAKGAQKNIAEVDFQHDGTPVFSFSKDYLDAVSKYNEIQGGA